MQNQYFFFSANSLFVMVNKPVCFVSSVQRFALGTHSIKKKNLSIIHNLSNLF
jgi:hypothetical protein